MGLVHIGFPTPRDLMGYYSTTFRTLNRLHSFALRTPSVMWTEQTFQSKHRQSVVIALPDMAEYAANVHAETRTCTEVGVDHLFVMLRELGLDSVQQGTVLSSFFWGCSLS